MNDFVSLLDKENNKIYRSYTLLIIQTFCKVEDSENYYNKLKVSTENGDVISNDPSFIAGHIRFIMVPFKPLPDHG